MISSRPAEILGLSDRGTIEAGKRADLVIIFQRTKKAEAKLTAGLLTYLSDKIKERFLFLEEKQELAAE